MTDKNATISVNLEANAARFGSEVDASTKKLNGFSGAWKAFLKHVRGGVAEVKKSGRATAAAGKETAKATKETDKAKRATPRKKSSRRAKIGYTAGSAITFSEVHRWKRCAECSSKLSCCAG